MRLDYPQLPGSAGLLQGAWPISSGVGVSWEVAESAERLVAATPSGEVLTAVTIATIP